jgi:acyl phosphate:glycerol-3-phosphate acyltransferase
VDIFWLALLILASFWLGACPFAYWIGKAVLHKDIRNYGDHNPGAANVFKAGSIKWGFLAVFMEIAKGAPFVLLAEFIGMKEPEIYSIGLCAVLGHAFSPFLKFQGGKATAVMAGMLAAVPRREILYLMLGLVVIGFFLLDGDGWRIVLTTAGGLLFAIIMNMGLWPCLLMVCLLIVISFKNRDALKKMPRPKHKIYIGFGQK